MKNILVIGAGEHGQVVAETARFCGYEKIDFLDDCNQNAIGSINQLEEFAELYDGVIVSIGNSNIRKTLIDQIIQMNVSLITLIHPLAYISPSAHIGIGSIILPGAVIHANAFIGRGCIISIGALIDHDAVVEDFSHINAGSVIPAGKKVSGRIEPLLSIN